jgi:hypothetical protein
MKCASDAYHRVRAVVADAADGELDGKIAEGEDKPMSVEPMADPTHEQAISTRSSRPARMPPTSPHRPPTRLTSRTRLGCVQHSRASRRRPA